MSKMSFKRTVSKDSFSSIADSMRHEFLSSGRVVTSPTPTPTSETPRDFQLICGNSPLLSPTVVSPFVTNGCHCGPECREPCCLRRGWTVGARNLMTPYDTSTKQYSGGTKSQVSTNAEYDSISVESGDSLLADSRGDEPLLSPTNSKRCGKTTTATDSAEDDATFVVVAGIPCRDSAYRDPVRCGCHVKVVDKTARKAKIKLILASIIALVFVIGEVLGGYFAGSLAIMTDAAHMLSDFASFLISLFAIWLASRPSSNKMSFGWHRAEVMGAVISVLIIWVITGVLFYEAIQRIIHPVKIDADIMLITACVGVFVNVFMCMVLHPHSHNHGHRKKKNHSGTEEGGCRGQEAEKGVGNGRSQKRRFWQRSKTSGSSHGSHENINVRAAFIHVIGDLLQSVGVVIAGYIIRFKPSWTIADPICTFLFCILVLISTLNVLKDALRVLMEGTPKHINYRELKKELEAVDGVRKAHSLHIWSLTLNRTALAAHLVIESSANHQEVLNQASKMLKEKYNITSTTLQVENHHDLMEECDTCQESGDS